MKRLIPLALLGAVLTACSGGDPIANQLGIHNVTAVASAGCKTLSGTGIHAGQEFKFSDSERARISVQAGAPLLLTNVKCTYDVTTTIVLPNGEKSTTITTQTASLDSTTHVVGRSGELYITALPTPRNPRELKVAEAVMSTPAIVAAGADTSACDTFEAVIAPSYSNAPIKLSETNSSDSGYYATGDTVNIKGTCTTKDGLIASVNENFTLSARAAIFITSSTNEDGSPSLTTTIR